MNEGNTDRDDLIALRRDMVAQMRVRGWSERQIQQALAQQLQDPDTKKPFSRATINLDLKAMREEWRQRAAANTATHQGRLMEQLEAVRKQAWQDNDLDVIVKSVKLEAEMLGLMGGGSGGSGGDTNIEQLNVIAGQFDTRIAGILDRARQVGGAELAQVTPALREGGAPLELEVLGESEADRTERELANLTSARWEGIREVQSGK